MISLHQSVLLPLLLQFLTIAQDDIVVSGFSVVSTPVTTSHHPASLVTRSAKQPKGAVPEFSVYNEENDDDDDGDNDEYMPVEATGQFAMAKSLLGEEEDDITNRESDILFDETAAPMIPPMATTTVTTTLVKNDDVATTKKAKDKVRVQYAAMEPGTVVHIQVGDIARARKAWKKRRRTGSPLLVPCSVLNVDLASTVRWNLIYLLEKFGESMSSSSKKQQPSNSGGGGIRISLSELSKRHRSHLKASLQQHATSLGYPDARALVKGLFHKQVQDAYGVRLVVNNNDDEDNEDDARVRQLWLETPLSRSRAQGRANQAAILQFCEPVFDGVTVDTLQHTGIVRNKRPATAVTAATSQEEVGTTKNLYQLKPLSAALRVSQEDVEQGIIQNGSLHAAVVFDYDPAGDAGVAPLITLSLNPQRNQVRDRLKAKQSATGCSSSSRIVNTPSTVQHMLKELHVGDGPIQGNVVKLVKGGALVDCGIGRPVTDKGSGSGIVPVYGLLRFKDAVRNKDDGAPTTTDDETINALISNDDDVDEDGDFWGGILSVDDLVSSNEEDSNDDDLDETNESSADLDGDDDDDLDGHVLAAFNLENDDDFADGEDITHLFQVNEDGSLTYTDPETGESKIIADVHVSDEEDEDEDNFDDIDEDDQPSLLSKSDSYETKGFVSGLASTEVYRTKTLHAGDSIDVFVKSVSKQSSQLMLTLDSSIKGMKVKDLKKESEVNKKLSRLAKRMGGFRRIRELQGTECDGVIRATSNAGDWLYVQPNVENLPVGVATVSAAITDQLRQGDSVRIQLNGVDEERGQLAIHILSKLSP